jgi:hypothetical protein
VRHDRGAGRADELRVQGRVKRGDELVGRARPLHEHIDDLPLALLTV